MKWLTIVFLLFMGRPVATSTVVGNTLPYKEITLPTIEIVAKKIEVRSKAEKTTSKKRVERTRTLIKEVLESIRFYNSVNKNLSSVLLEALAVYDGPPFIVSSGLRHGDKKSLHYTGHAIDIHYDDNALAFIKWSETKGKDWLEKYNIKFFIEDNSRSSIEELDASLKKYFRYIPWATGIHIHLEING